MKSLSTTARLIVSTLERLDDLTASYLSICRGFEKSGETLAERERFNRQRIMRELEAVVLLKLPTLKLGSRGYGSVRTRANFHGASLAGLTKPIVERLTSSATGT
jgi:hypothetical protein